MSEKLIIRNFGPIKNVELDLRKVNVLIGDQGTGKSTVAKVYSMIKNYVEIINFNQENPELEKSEDWQFSKFLKLFEIEEYLTAESEIIYRNGNNNKEVVFNTGNKLKVNFKRELNFPSAFNYITAERVFVSTLADAFFGLNQFGTKLPTLFNRFGNKYSTARKEKKIRIYAEILRADFAHINGVDSIIISNGNAIPLSNASSGLQGTIPMLVVFDSIVDAINKEDVSQLNRDNLLIIEEPELNLFPETQKKILEYIIRNNLIEDKFYKNILLITTHSPYILTSLNNLMYAYNVGKVNFEETDKIIPSKNWLNPNDVSVYKLVNGESVNIMDEELKQIKVEEIDEISEVLSAQWHEMADLNLVKH